LKRLEAIPEEDLRGLRFGRLVILDNVNYGTSRHAKLKCACDCGIIKLVNKSSLLAHDSESCGCLQRQLLSIKTTTHGKYHSLEYKAWAYMRTRATNPNHKHWGRYGGRGITVCERWKTFENFFEDMGEKPFPKAQLDRIDNDGNYELENCRWATPQENASNKSNTIWITLNGETKTLAEWSEITGMKKDTIKARINTYGWSADKALNTPLHINKRHHRGRTNEKTSSY